MELDLIGYVRGCVQVYVSRDVCRCIAYRIVVLNGGSEDVAENISNVVSQGITRNT